MRPATIKHYLREGLLPEPVRTSRNIAYYPPDSVERIRLIKQLQEERLMPLRVIKRMMEEGPERTLSTSTNGVTIGGIEEGMVDAALDRAIERESRYFRLTAGQRKALGLKHFR